MYRVFLASLLLLGAVGCSTQPAAAPNPAELPPALRNTPSEDYLIWSAEVAPQANEWLQEAKSRWPGKRFVVFACHGGPDATGMWYAWPDAPRLPVPVYYVARILHDLYPDRVIVLICCNGSGTRIGVPGVAYAKKKVWITCDRVWFDSMIKIPRPFDDGNTTGNINDFEYIAP